jgi:prevent-host-death family protein
MKTIGASEAKTNFSELLEQIAQGQRFTITKRGKPTAMLVPLDEEPAMTPDQAVAALRAVRARRCAAEGPDRRGPTLICRPAPPQRATG